MRNLAYRYRIYPDPVQQSLLFRTVGCTRFVGNQAKRIFKSGQSPSYDELCKLLTAWKDEHPWLREVPHHCLQQSLKDARTALDRFFQKAAGFPVFHRKGDKDSCRFPDPKQIRVSPTSVTLPKLGVIPWITHKPLVGTVKSVTVSLDGGHWYASVLCEIEGEDPAPKPVEPAARNLGLRVVGVDRGVVQPLVTSDGQFLPYPTRTARQDERERRLRRTIARRVKGSANRRKAVRALTRFQASQRRRRLDAARRSAVAMFRDADVLVFEALNVKAMTASAKGTIEQPGKNVRQKAGLNRAILDVGWGQIQRCAKALAVRCGKRVLEVHAAYTSQECAKCKHVSSENRESQPVFQCKACSHAENADLNASEVIKGRALADLQAGVAAYDAQRAEEIRKRVEAYERRRRAADARHNKRTNTGELSVPACGALGVGRAIRTDAVRREKQELSKAAQVAKGSPAL